MLGAVIFLPPVIIPAVILLEGFCATIVHALLTIIDFFLNDVCGAVCDIAIICQYDINK